MNFIKTVTVPQPNDHPPRSLGTFTFKEPNFHERKTINIAINHDIAVAGGLRDLLERVYDQIQAAATLPVVIVEPKDFTLDPLSDADVAAIYAAYLEGLHEVSPKND